MDNFDAISETKLSKIIEEANKAMERHRVKQEIAELATKHAIKIWFESPNKAKKRIVAPIYKSEDGEHTWCGRGPRPKWMPKDRALWDSLKI